MNLQVVHLLLGVLSDDFMKIVIALRSWESQPPSILESSHLLWALSHIIFIRPGNIGGLPLEDALGLVVSDLLNDALLVPNL